MPDINASTTLEECEEVCQGLRKAGWTKAQAEAAMGLEWTFDEELGDKVRVVELVPCSTREQ